MVSRRKLLTAIPLGTVIPNVSIAETECVVCEQTDVIVIGAGAAGLAAALTASQSGASVLIIEKMSHAGGNTLRSSGAINAVVVHSQQSLGVTDSVEQYYLDTLIGGGYRNNQSLVRVLASNSVDIIPWLQKLGVKFLPMVYQAFGGLHPRAHNTLAPFGEGYIKILLEQCLARGVRLLLEHQVSAICREKAGEVSGVVVTNSKGERCKFLATRGVVVATGGFAANNELCRFYDPRLKDLPTTNHVGATGDLINDLQDIGALFVDMDFIQLLPTVSIDGKGIGSIIAGQKFILIKDSGERFVDESARQDVITDAILKLAHRRIYMVFDSNGYESLSTNIRNSFLQGINTGETFKAHTIADLAIALGVPVENLRRSTEAFNSENSDKDGVHVAPFYAARMVLSVHYTMGGVAIDEQTRVIDREGNPIPHLYAAGEVTGGVHGCNRLGGSGLTDAFVFGRIAGRSVARMTN